MPKETLFNVGDKVTVVVAGVQKHFEVKGLREEDGQYGLLPADGPAPTGEDGEGEGGSPLQFFHPNAIIAPGQRFQYRQRMVQPEKGGIAAEANRLAREGFRLRYVGNTVNDDGDERALLIFEREVEAQRS